MDVTPARGATRVAVLRGEVRVGVAASRVLRRGEAAEVGPDGVVRLTPLPAEIFAALLKVVAPRDGMASWGPNLLGDPLFKADPSGGLCQRTEGLVGSAPGDGAIAVLARGHRFWPGARQTVAVGDIEGRLLVASVVATTPVDDPLQDRQSAILKVAFLDEHGREFANASRHVLHVQESRGYTPRPRSEDRVPWGGTPAVKRTFVFWTLAVASLAGDAGRRRWPRSEPA